MGALAGTEASALDERIAALTDRFNDGGWRYRPAMTGRQDNPASGFTLMDDPAHAINIPLLCKALGVKNIRVINPLDLEETRRVIAEEMERPEPSVIITNKPCVLIKREEIFQKGPVYAVDAENIGIVVGVG
jgi:TPP-dependent indolepyruvate ferredoxin oxidoreductase alpha subunit